MLSLESAGEALRALFVSDDVAKVQSALQAGANLEVMRVVGGTMRDLLLEEKNILDPEQDLDFATPLRPDKVEGLLGARDIKTIRKGKSFEHGTVIALLPREKDSNWQRQFEITSLRKDIKTDGRHAEVVYTEDWEEDSNRRDFSINALYGDLEGTIHDYHNGLGDLEERVVRFIGNREERIEEDALRILRFFRFSALIGKKGFGSTPWGKGPFGADFWIDPERKCMQAIKAKVHLIDRLSGERVWEELKKILSIRENGVRNGTLEAMKSVGVLKAIHPALTEIEVERKLGEFEDKYNQGKPFSPLARLSALVSQKAGAIQDVEKRLRFTREELKMSRSLIPSEKQRRPIEGDETSATADQSNEPDKLAWLRSFYKQGEDVARARLCLTAIRNGTKPNPYFMNYEWKDIPFRITGDDVMRELEIEAGLQVGSILESVLDWWLENDCKPSREACLEYLRKFKRK